MTNEFLFSLIAGVFIGGAAGYLGSLMLTKRMALVGDALGHVALPGMGLALLLGLDTSFGAFFFLLLGIFLIWLFEMRTSLPTEALVGVVFVASLAAGFLIVPEPELLEALFGDISDVSLGMALASVLFSALIFFIIKRVYSGLILASISGDLAKSEGINVQRQNFIYLFLIAALVALGVKIVGTLLVGALVIIPAATARNLSTNLREYVFWSIAFGIISCFLGALLYIYTGLPAGPMIILVSTFFFLISLVLKK
ncbi:MAG: metal ABC transporter permease [Candidatus Nealsonbacteria bacterium]|nr:metal ABC transporter permease [Candidatus Nealsonbacteria bacterium]